MAKWLMPERLAEDGAINVTRVGEQHLAIGDGKSGPGIVLSEFNAARLLGCLALMLEFPLSSIQQKMIVLGTPQKPLEAEFRFPEPKTLGESVAQRLVGNKLQETLDNPPKARKARRKARHG